MPCFTVYRSGGEQVHPDIHEPIEMRSAEVG